MKSRNPHPPGLELACLGLLLTAAPGLPAQTSERGRYWLTAGVGYDLANSSCDVCLVHAPAVGGIGATVRAGRTLNARLRVGASLDGFTRSYAGARETMANGGVMFSCGLDPFLPKGTFFTGGIGLSTYRADAVRFTFDTIPGVSGTGWGFMVGMGYDLAVSRHVSLTPLVNYAYGALGDLHVAGGGGNFPPGWKQYFYHLGLGVTFHR